MQLSSKIKWINVWLHLAWRIKPWGVLMLTPEGYIPLFGLSRFCSIQTGPLSQPSSAPHFTTSWLTQKEQFGFSKQIWSLSCFSSRYRFVCCVSMWSRKPRDQTKPDALRALGSNGPTKKKKKKENNPLRGRMLKNCSARLSGGLYQAVAEVYRFWLHPKLVESIRGSVACKCKDMVTSPSTAWIRFTYEAKRWVIDQ